MKFIFFRHKVPGALEESSDITICFLKAISSLQQVPPHSSFRLLITIGGEKRKVQLQTKQSVEELELT